MKTTISALHSTVLNKMKVPEASTPVSVGPHSFDFTVRITGQAVKGRDTMQKPTSRALTLETLALFIQRSGIQREKAMEILVEVLRDNIVLGDDQKKALMEVSGVAAAKARLDQEMSRLPKTPKAGPFSIRNISFEISEPLNKVEPSHEILGDAYVAHEEPATDMIPSLDDLIESQERQELNDGPPRK